MASSSCVAILLELGDVAGEEIAARAVDGVEIAVEDQARKMIIERRPAVMLVGDDVGDAPRDVVFLFCGREDRCRRGRRGRRRHGGA